MPVHVVFTPGEAAPAAVAAAGDSAGAAASWPADGHHTLRIVNAGTAGHSRVDVDAFAWIEVSP